MECTDDLNRVCEDIENCTGDTAIALSRIADNGQFFEVKADYGKSVAVGFIRLNGATVGAVANRSESYDAEGKRYGSLMEPLVHAVQEKQQSS